LRRLRLTAPAQLTLGIPELAITPVERWWSMPEQTRHDVLCILAKMITSGVIDTEVEVIDDDVHR
jgi:hypothetical protein